MRVGCSDLYTPRDAQNLRAFNIWIFVAMGLFIAATILIGEKFLAPGPVAWVLVVATIVALAASIGAYLRFLRATDELLRKIHIEGLAVGFGAGVLFTMGYRLFERLGAPKLDVNDGTLVMLIFWAVGQWMGMRRYAPTPEEA